MSQHLVELVDTAAARWPGKDAWIFDHTGERLTFADVERRTHEVAAALAAHGVRPGDRVAVMVANRPEFPLLWLALARLGAALVPVNTGYRELDGGHVVAHSGATLAVASPEFADVLRSVAPATSLRAVVTTDELAAVAPAPPPDPFTPTPETPTNIQYTSGTTGAPKGCVLPHRYWTTLADDLATAFPAITSDDVLLTAQPFHYIDPQWNVALGLRSGATLVVLDRFHPSTFWQKVRDHGVTWFYCLGLMPTLLLRMPACPEDREHRVRAITASAIPPELHAELEQRWGVPWYEAFGMTETGGDIRMYPGDHDELVGSGCIGRPAAHREVVIADEHGVPVPRGTDGELLIRGTGLMHRYHDDPDATAEAFRGGWFHTGDIARMDEQGRVFYVGRTKDMIRRSGENIAADEVERALLLHPDVESAAVVAVPDELRGEEVKAYVVLAASRSPEELATFCETKLARFKVPRYWSIVDSLPRTPSERVAKGRLREGDQRAGAYDRREGAWL
ncbi:AMP-binding protein [Prauserella rugosa]|uniref:Crotonobetaine/carnitine-CoA ligase n=1 Tax=Prauserella rugosa TaxID=43354 RepID=A0A660CBQ3_9PSEU|nr:AMP-binding protein [Prauserella rugosa]KMS86454.1 acyl-CoA synthetase [Streptomyces regensis]TWH20912.1 crotonobetaine/carnitine-CoA ligase [Prauserella rugosa]